METYSAAKSKSQNPKSKEAEGPESLFVTVTGEHRVRSSARQAATQDSWHAVHDFVFPLAGFENGHYDVKAEVIGSNGRVIDQRQSGFEVTSSIFASEHDYQEKVNQMLWIATPSEMQRLRAAAPAQRESLWNAFWAAKDITPTTDENETERSYFERIDYCEKHFGHGDRGYRSDRARVYVKYGPPDNIESMPFERDVNAYEIWYYYNLNLKFTFSDVNGFGEYRQTDPRL